MCWSRRACRRTHPIAADSEGYAATAAAAAAATTTATTTATATAAPAAGGSATLAAALPLVALVAAAAVTAATAGGSRRHRGEADVVTHEVAAGVAHVVGDDGQDSARGPAGVEDVVEAVDGLDGLLLEIQPVADEATALEHPAPGLAVVLGEPEAAVELDLPLNRRRDAGGRQGGRGPRGGTGRRAIEDAGEDLADGRGGIRDGAAVDEVGAVARRVRAGAAGVRQQVELGRRR